MLANWIIAWPLGEVLRFIALFGLVGGQIDGEWALAAESVRDGLLTLPSLVGNAALDGAGVLLALTLWEAVALGVHVGHVRLCLLYRL